MYISQNLDECIFLSEEALSKIINDQIINGAKIKSLNLGCSKLSNKLLRTINSFTELKEFDIEGTSIDLYELLCELTRNQLTNFRSIEKLSLKRMNELNNCSESKWDATNYYNMLFSHILKHFPLLSHLNLSNNNSIQVKTKSSTKTQSHQKWVN